MRSGIGSVFLEFGLEESTQQGQLGDGLTWESGQGPSI